MMSVHIQGHIHSGLLFSYPTDKTRDSNNACTIVQSIYCSIAIHTTLIIIPLHKHHAWYLIVVLCPTFLYDCTSSVSVIVLSNHRPFTRAPLLPSRCWVSAKLLMALVITAHMKCYIIIIIKWWTILWLYSGPTLSREVEIAYNYSADNMYE